MALRHKFHQIEQSFYAMLAKTSHDSLNEARSTFLSTVSHSAQRKHLGPEAKLVRYLIVEEAVWWGKDRLVFRRENDWGSIIAHKFKVFFILLRLELGI